MHICILNVQVIFEEKSWVFLGIPRHPCSSTHTSFSPAWLCGRIYLEVMILNVCVNESLAYAVFEASMSKFLFFKILLNL